MNCRRLFRRLQVALCLTAALAVMTPRPALAAWSLLSHTATNSATSPTSTSGIDTTGATLIVVIGATSISPVQGALSDNQSNKWYQLQSTQSGSQWTTIYFSISPTTNASHTFTMNASNFPALAVMAFSGSIGPLLAPRTAFTGGSTTLALSSLTPATNGALFIAGMCNGNADSVSINSGFTIADTNGGSAGQEVSAAYLIQGTAGAIGPTWTLGASRQFSAQMIVFQLQSSGGGEVSVVFGG